MYCNDRLYLYGGFDENFHLHNDFLEGVLEGDQVDRTRSLSKGGFMLVHIVFQL